MEYTTLIEKAQKEADPIRRLAYVATYASVMFTQVERATNKPFNPMLGELFELVTPSFHYLAE